MVARIGGKREWNKMGVQDSSRESGTRDGSARLKGVGNMRKGGNGSSRYGSPNGSVDGGGRMWGKTWRKIAMQHVGRWALCGGARWQCITAGGDICREMVP